MPPSHGSSHLEQLRSISLQAILLACGATVDPSDKNRWRTSQGTISFTGAKFFNWSQDTGGGGAIDLAMHLQQICFKEAVEWLQQNFPASAPMPISPVAPPPKIPFNLPPKNPLHVSAVKRYLMEARRLPAALVEPLLQSGRLYPDHRANAVFLLLGKQNNPVGAELRGTSSTRWRGMAPGSSKNLGFFSTLAANPSTIVLCESAIDAISCAAIDHRRLCVSTAGIRTNPPWLRQLLQWDLPVCCGFDSDHPGEAAAQAMISAYPQIQRMRPPLHDWNDTLRA